MPPSLLPSKVFLYDTTLRDGTQREGISLSLEDKLRIARRLDAFGIDFIEAGWPGSNPKDADLFARLGEHPWMHAKLVAFGSTRRVGVHPEDDPSLKMLIDAKTPVTTIFGKTSPLHVHEVLRTTLEENLRLIEESVAYLRSHGRRVIYDAEHFFDGYEADASYALETLKAAIRGGAETLVLCDTNGGTLPWRVHEVVKMAVTLGHPIGIHTHNDSECAVANAISAVTAGASQVQGTVNGYGERCGNANLCAIIPSLELKLNVPCLPAGRLSQLSEVSHFVAEVANLAPDEHMAYVGRSAFAHKGGVHVAAMRRSAASYQHVDPNRVGNVSRIVVSELSGKATVQGKAEELGLSLENGTDLSVLETIKKAESQGYAFEAAEASVALMIARQSPGYQPPFQLIDFAVQVSQGHDRETQATATVNLSIQGQQVSTTATGNGPVSALDAALRKALLPLFPALSTITLVDYKVRILDSERGTQSNVRVLIDSTDGTRRWSTVGAGTNIIAASWRALVESLEYALRIRPSKSAVSAQLSSQECA